MLTPVDARRRWFGTFFIIVASGQLMWGLTFLAPVLRQSPGLFLAYWLSCFALTSVALGIALYDLSVMRKRMRDEKRSAFHRAFGDCPGESRRKS
jgi:hypothetical protein